MRVWAIDPSGRSTGTELKGHQDSVDQLRWDPKQPEVLGTASGDKTVRIWDTRSGKCANAIETKGETSHTTSNPNPKPHPSPEPAPKPEPRPKPEPSPNSSPKLSQAPTLVPARTQAQAQHPTPGPSPAYLCIYPEPGENINIRWSPDG